jgi:uncharacterized protein
MKTKFFILGVLFIMMGVLAYRKGYAPGGPKFQSKPQAIHSVMVGGAKVLVEVADTPEKQEHGLMDREVMPADNGMLFLFSLAAQQSFWNERTRIPLDVIWINNKKVAGISPLRKIADGPETISSPEPVDAVLEVNAGWAQFHRIEVGDEVRYE